MIYLNSVCEILNARFLCLSEAEWHRTALFYDLYMLELVTLNLK